MTGFDYAAPAELYPGRNPSRSRSLRYRRFETAAEALRFLVEEMPPEFRRGAVLEVDEERFEGAHIGALYDAAAYPLARA